MTIINTVQNDQTDERKAIPQSDEKDHGHHHGPELEPDETPSHGVNPDEPLADPDAK